MTGLKNLPIELLLRVCGYLSERGICSVMGTCHDFYATLQASLYRRNIEQSRSTLLPYVVAAGDMLSITLALNVSCKPKLKLLATNRDGNTALMAAIATNNVDAASLLIERGGSQLTRENRFTGWRPLTLAVARNQEQIVRLLISKKVSACDAPEFTRHRDAPLILAAQSGRHCMIAMLLKLKHLDRYVTDKKGHNALELAIIAGSRRTVELLVQDTAKLRPEMYETNALFLAISSGYIDIVETLVKAKWHVLPQHVGKALLSGNEEMVLALRPEGAQLAQAQWQCQKALACAAIGGLRNYVEHFLLEANTADHYEALLLAAENMHWQVANVIMENYERRIGSCISRAYPKTAFYLNRAKDSSKLYRMRCGHTYYVPFDVDFELFCLRIRRMHK